MASRAVLFLALVLLVSCTIDSVSAARKLRVLGKGKRDPPSSIAVIGGSPIAPIVDLLKSSLPNTQVDGYSSVPASSTLNAYGTVILVRTNGNTAVSNWVKAGGRLVTEWSAAGWALDTANLLGTTRTNHSGYVATGTHINFTSPGQGLAKGIANPYSDGGRTEYFYSYKSIDASVTTIQATIVLNLNYNLQSVFISGPSNNGCVVILGDDWSDSFASASKDTQQLILNAVQFDCSTYECLGDCCLSHSVPSCEDPGLASCVCSNSQYAHCCQQAWTDDCVAAVESTGCGNCHTSGSCCVARSTPGCENRNTTTAVCKQNNSCCTAAWTQDCVNIAVSLNAQSCQGNCCAPQNSGGCSDSSISSCVCSVDPYCCQVAWDSYCVESVQEMKCGVCCS